MRLGHRELAARRLARPWLALIALMPVVLFCGISYMLKGTPQDTLLLATATPTTLPETTMLPTPLPAPSVGEFCLNLCGLFYMFVALFLCCDEFFVPALDVISNKLGLSPDVAGATFMAAGGSAPEFFTALAGALSPVPSDVGVAAIVGSAVFNVLFVIGACGVASPQNLRLTWYPLTRDSSFYVVSLGLMVWAFGDGKIAWTESLVMFSWYLIYCIFMSCSGRIEKMVTKPEMDEGDRAAKARFDELDTNKDGKLTQDEVKQDRELAAQFRQLDTNKDGVLDFEETKWQLRSTRNWKKDEGEGAQQQLLPAPPNEEEPNHPFTLDPPAGGCTAWLWYIVTLPLAIPLIITVPDVRRDSCKCMYIPSFVLSIVWIAFFSQKMVDFSDVVGRFTGIPTGILGLTLLAWGTSVPDLLTSVLVTLQGHGDMAVSSSIGSNIFDVTVGLPVPWLVFAAINSGKKVPVGSGGLTTSITMLVGMVVFTIGSIMLCKWQLSKLLGSLMLIFWCCFTAFSTGPHSEVLESMSIVYCRV